MGMDTQIAIGKELIKTDRYRTNHTLHLILSIITIGWWIPVWLLVAVSNSIEISKALRRIDKLERLDEQAIHTQTQTAHTQQQGNAHRTNREGERQARGKG